MGNMRQIREMVTKIDIEVSKEYLTIVKATKGYVNKERKGREERNKVNVYLMKGLGYKYLQKVEGVYQLSEGYKYLNGDESYTEYELMDSGELRYIASYDKESTEWLTNKDLYVKKNGEKKEQIVINLTSDGGEEQELLSLYVG